MNIYAEYQGSRFFASATATSQIVSGIVLNQNDLLPISLQFANTDGTGAVNMTGWSASVVIVTLPAFSSTSPPTQLALAGMTLGGDSKTYTGTIQINTIPTAALTGTQASAYLAVFASKNDTTADFEVQLQAIIQARAYNTGSIAPTSPTGTQYFFNSTANRWEWYVNSILVGTMP